MQRETSSSSNEKPKKMKRPDPSPHNPTDKHILPTYMEDGRLITKGINKEGESGRAGFHPFHFLHVAWMGSNTVSKYLNLLWPFVPAAIAVRYALPERHGTIFALNYIAMVPAANMIGCAGQEFARKLPRVLGILIETTLGSVVEIILFMVLVARTAQAQTEEQSAEYISVLQAAIIGSIITNLLLCLGFCFFVGGLKNNEQQFHPVISETGSGLLLVAAFGVLIPSAFFTTLRGATAESSGSSNTNGGESTLTLATLNGHTLGISHGTSIILMIAFVLFIVYSAVSSHSVFDEILAADEERDNDRERDAAKKKFTMTECVIMLTIAIALVALIAIYLVEQIHYVVEEGGVPDAFLGFILVPLVEKLAEHVTSIDEAYDNQINFALYHCIGPSIQTLLFNGPLAVIVSWGLGTEMDLNFEIFMIVILVLSILVVGNFLRDGSSNYLEGALLIIVYAIIALAMWYYPNPTTTSTNGLAAGS